MKFEYISDLKDFHVISNPIFVLPIMRDHQLHRCLTQISFLYIYDIEDRKEYIVNASHHDYPITKNLNLIRSKFKGKLYSYNKSNLNKIWSDCIDCNILYWCQFNEPMEIEVTSEVKLYYQWYSSRRNINDIIPLMCWLIYLRNLRSQCVSVIKAEDQYHGSDFYNNAITLFTNIENSGLGINPKVSKQYINKEVTKLFTQYNLYTSTGRPSNHFGGINFAALNKTNGIREMIIPSSDSRILVEYDYDSMHLRLAANLISYDLPRVNLHEYFGRFYFNTPSLGAENYEISKNLTWYLLYGNISSKYLNIPFFQSVNNFKNTLWKQFNSQGYVEMPISKRRIFKDNFKDITKNILFNYMLQGYETEFNVLMLEEIFKYLLEKKSKIILYTYDSFLFDIHPEDGKEVVYDIEKILSVNKMTVKIHYGKNYQKMKRLTE